MNKLIYLWMMLVSTFGTCYGCKVAFGQEVPPEPVPVETAKFHVAPSSGIPAEYSAYTLCRFNLGEVKAAVDVYTIYNGKVLVTEAIETSKKGEFVFTGPPGKYTIRITTYDPTKGFATISAETVIKSPSGVVDPLPPPVDPQAPVTPVDPNTPTTGPPAEGKFGIGLVAYNWLVLNRPGNVVAVRQIAANYEWAAKALETKSIKEVGDELTKRNDLIYDSNKALQPLREAIREIGNRHVNVSGIIRTLSEFQTAYQETSIGIRAAVGK